jgi:predicted aspartyl protease
LRSRAPLVLSLAAGALSWAQCTQEQFAQAESLLVRHDLARAEALAKSCDSSGPRSAPFKVLLGQIALRRARVEAAERDFRDAIAVSPEYAGGWFGLGHVSECTFNRKTARDCFRKAHELAPTAAAAVFHWALTLEGAEQGRALESYLGLARAGDARGIEQARGLLAVRRALGDRKPFGLVSAYARTEIRLEPVLRNRELRAYRVAVSINGGEPVRLLLDTGAGGIVLNAGLAERFQVKRLAPATVSGLGDTGDVRGYVGTAERIRVGGVEFRDAVVTVGEGPRIGGEQGLVGTDIFERFLVTLDLPNAVLRLEPFPGSSDDAPADRGFEADPDAERIYRLGHSLLVPTSVSGADPAMFILDTGASQTLIARDFAAELARMRSAGDDVPLSGISGKINGIDAADDLKFKFGGFSVRCLDTLSVDLKRHSDDMGLEVAGFLGFPMLKLFSITIDYRNGMVKFECPTAQAKGR